MRASQSRLGPAIGWTLLIAVALLLLLLALPLAQWLESAQRSPTFGLLLNSKKAVAAVIGVIGLVVLGVLLWRRSLRWLLVAVVAGVLLVEAVAALQFQQLYPRSDLFGSSRYQDAGKLLLGKDVLLSSYEPVPLIKLQHSEITKAAVPVIDVHFHFESMPANVTPARLVEAMDAAGVEQVVNLGGIESLFDKFATEFRDAYPGRFILFVKPNPDGLMQKDGVAKEVAWLKRAASRGAQGIKENKSFGMGQVDSEGKRIAIDDLRLDPYWRLAGRLGWPVLVHTGEPKSFWLPIDSHNERFGELLANPAWSLYGKAGIPPFEQLMTEREHLLARYPETNFIGAHFGMNPDNLAYTAELLDKYPNYYVDMSSVVSELGRQPFSTRRFFIKYQDRILFGTDGGYGLEDRTGWTAEHMYRSYFEFLETDNEYIEYPMQSVTKQGSWRVYGLNLPADVLEKVYRTNALRLIPTPEQVKERLAALPAGE